MLTTNKFMYFHGWEVGWISLNGDQYGFLLIVDTQSYKSFKNQSFKVRCVEYDKK